MRPKKQRFAGSPRLYLAHQNRLSTRASVGYQQRAGKLFPFPVGRKSFKCIAYGFHMVLHIVHHAYVRSIVGQKTCLRQVFCPYNK